MARTISVNDEAETYCPPELICPYPASLPDSERKLLQILNRHNFNYVLSGRIAREADNIGAEVSVSESNGSIVYTTDSQELEARVAALVESEPGAHLEGD